MVPEMVPVVTAASATALTGERLPVREREGVHRAIPRKVRRESRNGVNLQGVEGTRRRRRACPLNRGRERPVPGVGEVLRVLRRGEGDSRVVANSLGVVAARELTRERRRVGCGSAHCEVGQRWVRSGETLVRNDLVPATVDDGRGVGRRHIRHAEGTRRVGHDALTERPARDEHSLAGDGCPVGVDHRPGDGDGGWTGGDGDLGGLGAGSAGAGR